MITRTIAFGAALIGACTAVYCDDKFHIGLFGVIMTSLACKLVFKEKE